MRSSMVWAVLNSHGSALWVELPQGDMSPGPSSPARLSPSRFPVVAHQAVRVLRVWPDLTAPMGPCGDDRLEEHGMNRREFVVAASVGAGAATAETSAGTEAGAQLGSSASRIAVPAAPRTVLCTSVRNFHSNRGHGRNRPTVTDMPPPASRSSLGCGRSLSARTTMGCTGALGSSSS